MKKTIKKIIAAATVTAALLFALAGGTANVLTVKEQPAAATEPCVGPSCWPPNPPVKHIPTRRVSLPPVW
jgi:hypothetical protein